MIKEISRVFSSFLLGIILCCYCPFVSIAQTNHNNPSSWTKDMQFNIATNQTFFKTYDLINSIFIGYKDLKPYYILLKFENDSHVVHSKDINVKMDIKFLLMYRL